jgi:hypothetical protein
MNESVSIIYNSRETINLKGDFKNLIKKKTLAFLIVFLNYSLYINKLIDFFVCKLKILNNYSDN